jgi:4-amino-4-deoxy-L-arabinose transferase-like glycosyltransferase
VIQEYAPRPIERRLYVGLAVLLAALWLAGLGARPLFNPDEGRYAEIPREMLAGGDWIIPHLNGLAYAEKPPLQYWATALSYRWLGFNEFAARLYCALCALGTIGLVWIMARHLGGVQAAWRAAAMLSGMLIFAVLGHLLTLDMSLTFYLTLSLTGFLFAQPVRNQPRHARFWMLLAWAAAALGVMTKGIVAAAIPAAVLILYSLWTRDFSAWRRLQLPLGVPLFLLIAVPWHWLAARRDGEFLQFYFVHEHVARYLTPVAQRVEPWWFFVGVFVGGTAPWTLSALRMVVTGWRRRSISGFDAPLFMWIWVVFIVVFFSLSDSKLMPYILPIMPVVAAAAALAPPEVLKRDYLVAAIFTLILGVGLGAASLRWPQVLSSSDRAVYFLPLGKAAAKVSVLLSVTAAFVLVQGARDVTRAGVFLGVGWCLTWIWLGVAAAAVAPVYSGIALAQAMPRDERDALIQAVPIYSIGTYDQSLEFYLRRTVTLVQYRGELDYGLIQNPDVEIPEIEDFERRWSADSQAFAVMERSMFEKLQRDGVPMRVIGRTASRLLAARQ